MSQSRREESWKGAFGSRAGKPPVNRLAPGEQPPVGRCAAQPGPVGSPAAIESVCLRSVRLTKGTALQLYGERGPWTPGVAQREGSGSGCPWEDPFCAETNLPCDGAHFERRLLDEVNWPAVLSRSEAEI